MLIKQVPAFEATNFMLSSEQERTLLFVTRSSADANAPAALHWSITASDAPSLEALARWVHIRRDRWANWANTAAIMGPALFNAYMRGRLAEEGVPVRTGTMVRFDFDPRKVEFGEHTQLDGVPGKEVLYTHTFKSVAAAKRFFDWFRTGENSEESPAMMHRAIMQGTDTLSARLEEIADSKAKTPRRKSANRNAAHPLKKRAA